jgi:hypothetical protein
LKVSMLIGTWVRAASCSITGITRRSSSSTDTGGARTGRFAADIEQVAPSSTSFMGDRGLGGVVRAAIGKRVRGDVDDAHDLGTVEAQDAAGAIELGRGIEHR